MCFKEVMRHSPINILSVRSVAKFGECFPSQNGPEATPLEKQAVVKTGGLKRSSSGGHQLHVVSFPSNPRAELNWGVWSPNKATPRPWAEGIRAREQGAVLAKPPPQLDLLLQDLKILSVYHVFIVNFILLLTEIS